MGNLAAPIAVGRGANLARSAEMWDRSLMPRVAGRLGGLVALVTWVVVLIWPVPAWAWIENHVEGLQTRIQIDRSGKALVEHRLELRMNGNQRQKKYRIRGIDSDARPLDDSYVVPFEDALAGTLDQAIPLTLTVTESKDDPTVSLDIAVDDRKGLYRGRFLFVLRYETDLRATNRVRRDGALVAVSWQGPRLDGGYDNARTTFVVPASPSPPRAPESADLEEEESGPRDAVLGDGSLPATYLSEVRRGQTEDEIELLRTYAPKGEGVIWTIRVDPRAIEPPSREAAASAAPEPAFQSVRDDMATPDQWLALGIGVLLLVFLLGWARGREVARLADDSGALVPPLLPLPPMLRGLGAALAVVAGLALQLRFERPILGALLIVVACLLLSHGVARPRPDAIKRGPGRWLTVTEHEALGPVPPIRGAVLDSSTRLGKGLLLLLWLAHGVGVWWLNRHSRLLALQLGFDAVIWLAIFGTGRLVCMPPDMAVEPARFLRKVARRIRKTKGLERVRLVPRIRVPHGEVDPDELRLGVVPKLPLRGFSGIEIGVTYALGFGPRVAMPEILVRVVSGSPCDEALALVSTKGRITPGRKPDERVIAISPRFPTAKMTAEIAAALVARVTDRGRAEREAAEPETRRKRRRARRRPAAATANSEEAA